MWSFGVGATRVLQDFDGMERSRPVTVEQMYGEQQLSEEAIDAAPDRSLSPRSSSSLYDTVAGLGIGPTHTILDIGARDARHGLELAARLGCRVFAVEPVESNLRAGGQLIAAHEHGELVEPLRGVVEEIPSRTGRSIWSSPAT